MLLLRRSCRFRNTCSSACYYTQWRNRVSIKSIKYSSSTVVFFSRRYSQTNHAKPSKNARDEPSKSLYILEDFTLHTLPALKVLAESLSLMRQSPFFQKWTSRDWLLGLLVYAHHNKVSFKEQDVSEFTVEADKLTVSMKTLSSLLRYVSICDAVYAPSLSQFCTEAGVEEIQIVRVHPGGVLSPKVILLIDHTNLEIIVAVRGSASILDFCTDICLFNEPFQDGYGHRGIVHASRWLLKHFRRDIDQLHQQYPEYTIVLTGHSLGAGVACMTAIELHQQSTELLRNKLQCFAFATPACTTPPIAQYCQDFVTSVIYGDDCVPRLHEQSLEQLEKTISNFDWRSSLRQMIVEEVEAKRNQMHCHITNKVEERKVAMRKNRDQGIEQLFQLLKRLEEPTKALVSSRMAQVGMDLTSQIKGQMSDHFRKALKYFSIRPVDVKRLEAVKQSLMTTYKLQGIETKRFMEKVSDASSELTLNVSQPFDYLYERLHRLYDVTRPACNRNRIVPAGPEHANKSQSTFSQSPLVSPGRVLYLHRQESHTSKSNYIFERAENDAFTKVIISENMISDHLCSNYKRVLCALLSNTRDSRHV